MSQQQQEDLMNTVGAAALLGVSSTWVHKLVYSRRLPAYTYNEEGFLVSRDPGQRRQGQGLYFRRGDVLHYAQHKRRPGRPPAQVTPH